MKSLLLGLSVLAAMVGYVVAGTAIGGLLAGETGAAIGFFICVFGPLVALVAHFIGEEIRG